MRILSADKHGNIYVGTTFGLIVFDGNFSKPEEIVFRVYQRKDRANSIGGNDIFDICTTKSGIPISELSEGNKQNRRNRPKRLSLNL